MGQSYETTGKSAMADIASKQPHELLIQLGGALAVLLSVVLTAIEWSQGPISASRLPTVTTLLVLNVVLGGTLWVSAAVVHKNLMNGAIVAGVVSAVLVVFGGQTGTIGGRLGRVRAGFSPGGPSLPRADRDTAPRRTSAA